MDDDKPPGLWKRLVVMRRNQSSTSVKSMVSSSSDTCEQPNLLPSLPRQHQMGLSIDGTDNPDHVAIDIPLDDNKNDAV